MDAKGENVIIVVDDGYNVCSTEQLVRSESQSKKTALHAGWVGEEAELTAGRSKGPHEHKLPLEIGASETRCLACCRVNGAQ